MLTLTSQYALRALICLAQQESSEPMTGQRIAEMSAIPAKYLSKVLGNLVRMGLLESSRGKHGGYRLVRSPDETSLLEVLASFQPIERKECPLGNKQCNEGEPCRVHERWRKMLDVEKRFLRETTVQDVSTTRWQPAAVVKEDGAPEA